MTQMIVQPALIPRPWVEPITPRRHSRVLSSARSSKFWLQDTTALMGIVRLVKAIHISLEFLVVLLSCILYFTPQWVLCFFRLLSHKFLRFAIMEGAHEKREDKVAAGRSPTSSRKNHYPPPNLGHLHVPQSGACPVSTIL